MFIDLSGFTPLTESLMRKGNEGAEKLSGILNNVFGPMVALVFRRGGFIPHFAGDAFTAVFPTDSPAENAAAFIFTAREIRDLFSSKNFRFGDFPIGIKIGLSVGTVEWGVLGKKKKAYYFRGDAISSCTECQVRASQQEIILDENLQRYLPKGFPITIYGSRRYFLFTGSSIAGEPLPAIPQLPPVTEKVAAEFLPDSVLHFNQQGEFRSIISVFISFIGVESHELLNQFVSNVLRQIYSFSGYFKEVDFGDKGGVLVCFFGAPVSFENNVERALEFVATVRSELDELQNTTSLAFRVGITSGVAYCGIVGGEERCQYAAVGNRVNLAARLMTYADWGEVLVDEEVRKNRQFLFKHKGDIHYKGIEGPVPTFILMGRNAEFHPAFTGQLIGRQEELKQLIGFSEKALLEKRGAVAYVYGEAGIGKSRLTYELRKYLIDATDFRWFGCQADQILRKPFNPFIYFLKNYFQQSPEHSEEENVQKFRGRLQELMDELSGIDHPQSNAIRKEIRRTEPILGALIGLHQEDSIWQNLDAQGRYRNTLAALTNLFVAESLLHSLVIELEDAHWLDPSSREFLEEFAGRLRQYPILLLITSRYSDDGTKPPIFSTDRLQQLGVPTLEMDINIMLPETIRSFAEIWLGGSISQEFFELLLRTTNGNPFYLEQLLEYFSESNLLAQVDGRWHIKDKSIKLSNSIQAILTARIDRLSTLVRETVKAAAVIGREFEVPVLSEVLKGQESFIQENGSLQLVLQEQIKMAEQGQIWRAMTELRYIFKHSLLREAAYDMQLRTRLRELHLLIAEAIEKVYAGQIEQHYEDLAFHYELAEVKEKSLEYLHKAGDYARRNFQNQRAISYYDKVLALLQKKTDRESEFKMLLKKGKVLELIGEWEACSTIYNKALSIAQELKDKLLLGRANNCLGHLLMLQGAYRDARLYLEIAATFFEAISDLFGKSKVYGDLGNLYFRQGDYESAKSHFTRSIELSEGLPYSTTTAQIVANLGLAFMNQGNYDEGIRWQRKQLDICRERNDKQGMANLYTNMGIVYFEKGDYDAAQDCYERGLAFAEELGNKLLTSIAIGCLGSVFERKGQYDLAMAHFEQDLQLTEELGDKQGTAIALGLIGELNSVMGRFENAVEFLNRTLNISMELGYQKGIAKAVNTLGDVYYFTGQFERSLEFYNRAIEVTRQINNKLVLGSSLYEKGLVLLELERFEEAAEVHIEARRLAEELGNPDLIFNVEVLAAQIAYRQGEQKKALDLLRRLQAETRSPEEQAEVFYYLFVVAKDHKSGQKAQDLFRKLYEETPRYLYELRLRSLADL